MLRGRFIPDTHPAILRVVTGRPAGSEVAAGQTGCAGPLAPLSGASVSVSLLFCTGGVIKAVVRDWSVFDPASSPCADTTNR